MPRDGSRRHRDAAVLEPARHARRVADAEDATTPVDHRQGVEPLGHRGGAVELHRIRSTVLVTAHHCFLLNPVEDRDTHIVQRRVAAADSASPRMRNGRRRR